MEKDRMYMHECIELAKMALENGNPPVGSLLVHEHQIIGRGIESGKSSGDITKHAEILAIQDALKNGFAEALPHCILYSTHEPCLMCSYVIRHHQIGRIRFGLHVPLLGGQSSEFKILETETIPKWGRRPEIKSGLLKHECEILNDQFTEYLSNLE
ncbi:nucleoside deaminase [Chryseobacterium sp. A301]